MSFENNFISFSFGKIQTEMINGVEKKRLPDLPYWKSITETQIKPAHKSRAIRTGKISGITVIDFDDKKVYKKLLKEHPELKECYTVKSPNGYHIYFKYTDKLKTGVNCFKKFPNTDIRNDDAFIISPPTRYTKLDGENVKYKHLHLYYEGENGDILDVPDYFFEDEIVNEPGKVVIESDDEENDKVITPEPAKISSKDKEINFLLSLLSSQYYDNYDHWLRVAFIIFNETNDYKILDNFSKKSKTKYNPVNNLKIWNGFTTKKDNLKIASLKMYAKECNAQEYAKYYKLCFNFKSCNTSSIAEHFKSLYSDKFLYTNETLYYFNGVYWKKDNKLNAHLSLFLSNDYFNLLIGLFQEFEIQNTDENKQKEINEVRKYIYKLRNSGKRDGFIKDILIEISKDVKFDTQSHLFAFENCIFNTDTLAFESPNFEDYVSLTTGFDYNNNYDENLVQELDKFIDTIFPDPELKSFYLSVLSSGLQGKNLEKFIIASGSGGNGKGVINELALDLFGDYGYVLNNTVLLRPLGSGPNPEIANLHNKRFVISREPNSKYKINTSMMKDLTGGNQIKARALYSNDCNVFLRLSLILECNKKPALDEVDPAVERRINEVEFKSKFVEKDVYNTLPEEEKQTSFLRNSYYKTPEFKDKYKQALFQLLIEPYRKFKDNKYELVVPDQVRKKTADYLMTSDDISEWVNEFYQKTNNSKDVIKLKQLFEDFKSSDYYQNFSKADKRKYNYKNFTAQFESNLFLKAFVCQDSSGVYILKNYKEKDCDITASTTDIF
jgi:P4 family phage/plasmid primase-like protien